MSYAMTLAQPSRGYTLAEASQSDKSSIFRKSFGTAAAIMAGAIGGMSHTVTPMQQPAEPLKWLANSGVSTSSVAWDNLLNLNHAAMLSPEVKKFQLSMFHTDMQAVRDIYDIAYSKFNDVPDVTFSYRQSVDRETRKPQLFLRVDTHGMDLDEQIDRELLMREVIAKNPRLVEAKQYHVITVV